MRKLLVILTIFSAITTTASTEQMPIQMALEPQIIFSIDEEPLGIIDYQEGIIILDNGMELLIKPLQDQLLRVSGGDAGGG